METLTYTDKLSGYAFFSTNKNRLPRCEALYIYFFENYSHYWKSCVISTTYITAMIVTKWYEFV